MQIHIEKNGTQIGPFTEEQTRGMVSAGMLSGDDSAWIEGTPDWKPLSLILRLAQPPELQNETDNVPPASSFVTNGLSGVGGWLLFFCIQLTIFPVISLVKLANAWSEAKLLFIRFPTFKTSMIVEGVGAGLILIYGFSVAYRIWTGTPSGPTIAKRYLLIRFFGWAVVELVGSFMRNGLPPKLIEAVNQGSLFSDLREVGYFLIWWFYFTKSKRVKNTYGEESATAVPQHSA